MEKKIIRNVGKIFFQDEMTGGSDIRYPRQFLADTAVAFAEGCKSYYDVTKEFQFAYGEKQVNSALLPAISKNADAVLLEQPISRKSNQNSSSGWLDYWVAYKSTVILIEVKHSWNAIRTNIVGKHLQKTWHGALAQLKGLEKREVKGLAMNRSAFKMALLIVPFYASSNDMEKLVSKKEDETQELFSSFVEKIKPAANWSCLWWLHENLQVKSTYQEGNSARYFLHPCVGMIAKVVSVT